mmetsp:Transcript_18602/g.25792  ORF Transcript_18602/g.25792 Transcript_18602/m.25792 type:complete len:337 (-) Transcript_18602:154-1164(-)|eukprot:CAMPEP_0196589410 /NCGR_PEP_ID=MMETSP1081-20130531/63458_1 /TAXON_ID=36882 /ORGANISM="Pyramimonas amylifera, Strain CCMP720" /LENGTH=336 /DNA_ID=CAMNT_0041912197 /DNA_START=242 /DNA_END=1252 /DNA_ORIENTATION=+
MLSVFEKEVSLETIVGGVPLKCCVYNSAGPRSGSKNSLVQILRSHSGAVVSKSATLIAQNGNPLPRTLQIPLNNSETDWLMGSLNSEGLPNRGIDFFLNEDLVNSLNCENGKPYFVSISGLTLLDNVQMISRIATVGGVAGIELNLACPNIPGKPVVAYDFEQMDEVLRAVTSHPDFDAKPLGVKLAPYLDLTQFKHAADILNKYSGIKYVVVCNTMGSALAVDWEKERACLAPRGGLGGLAGAFIKPVALGNCRMLRTLLRPSIDLVGCGGISSGRDAFEFILCGAAAVQIGTTHWVEGPQCFERIASELKSIMRGKGYKSIDDFRGKLALRPSL